MTHTHTKYDTNEFNLCNIRDRESTGGCQGRDGLAEGWIGNLGLADANYYM